MSHPMFQIRFPRSTALGFEPVSDGTAEHPGFDAEEVRQKLGEKKFKELMGAVRTVFCCGHRTHPENHPDKALAGTEVHCIYATDLEKFLRGKHA
ncbi:MAG TPA: hypothetical protein VI685_04195 [Candidatus Angelobacter sp.]